MGVLPQDGAPFFMDAEKCRAQKAAEKTEKRKILLTGLKKDDKVING